MAWSHNLLSQFDPAKYHSLQMVKQCEDACNVPQIYPSKVSLQHGQHHHVITTWYQKECELILHFLDHSN